jgi:broad specificity phosphatase PhoE
MNYSGIPDSILRSIPLVPRDRRVSLLVRHAHRPDPEPGSYGNEIELSREGIVAAEQLGTTLSHFSAGRLQSSSMPRAVATASAIAKGAGWNVPLEEDWRLGMHGPFVIDPIVAGPLILKIGAAEMIRRQLHNADPPPGMRPTSEGVVLILQFLSKSLDAAPALDLNVTHDNIMATTIGALLGVDFRDDNWPSFLEGLFIWREGSSLVGVWRGKRIGLLSDEQC